MILCWALEGKNNFSIFQQWRNGTSWVSVAPQQDRYLLQPSFSSLDSTSWKCIALTKKKKKKENPLCSPPLQDTVSRAYQSISTFLWIYLQTLALQFSSQFPQHLTLLSIPHRVPSLLAIPVKIAFLAVCNKQHFSDLCLNPPTLLIQSWLMLKRNEPLSAWNLKHLLTFWPDTAAGFP